MPSSENFFVSGAPADAPVTNPDLCQTDFVQIFGGNRQCGNQFKTFTSKHSVINVKQTYYWIETT